MGDALPVLGLLGGTFDPVHYGHLDLATEVADGLDLAEVRLVPAGDPPHRGTPGAGPDDRVAMLRLALADYPRLALDTREVARRGKSYTVLTLEELRREAPARAIALIVGADAFLGLPTWHRWHELFDLAHIVVVARPGIELAGALAPPLAAQWEKRFTSDAAALRRRPAGAIVQQPIRPRPISASAIRAALAQGDAGVNAVAGLLPPAVLAYIRAHHLYRSLDAP